MGTIAKSVAIRIGVDGKADFKRDISEEKAHVVRETDAMGDAVERMGKRSEAAAARQAEAWKKQARLGREAFEAEQRRLQFDRAMGFGPVQSGSAARSAEAFMQAGGRRLSTAGRVNMMYQAQDTVISLAGGQNPAMVALQQGSQVMGVMAAEGIKLSRSLVVLGGAVGALTGLAVGLAAAWNSNEAATKRFETATFGAGRALGMTAEQMEEIAQQAAEAGKISVSAARDIEIQFAKTGRIGEPIMLDLISVVKDFAAVMGVDVPTAAGILATSFAKPDQGAHTLNSTLGILDKSTADLIEKLVKEGDLLGAQQVLLKNLKPAIDGASERVTSWSKAFDQLAISASNAWSWIGKAIDAALGMGDGQDAVELARLKAEKKSAEANAARGFTNPYYIDTLDRKIKGLQDKIDKDAARVAPANAAAVAQNLAEEDARNRPKGPRATGKSPAELAAMREDLDLQYKLEIAQANGDAEHIYQLERAIELRRMEAEWVAAGLSKAEAARKAEAQWRTLQNSGPITRPEQLIGQDPSKLPGGPTLDPEFMDLGRQMGQFKQERQAEKTRAAMDLANAFNDRLAGGFRRFAETDGKSLLVDMADAMINRLYQGWAQKIGPLITQLVGAMASSGGGSGFLAGVGNFIGTSFGVPGFESGSYRAPNLGSGLTGIGPDGNASPIGSVMRFAKGVRNAPGGWADVGEYGKERMYVPAGADIYSHPETQRMDRGGFGGGFGGIVYSPTYNVHGSGPEIDALRRQMDQDKLEFKSNVVATVRQAQEDLVLR